MEIKAITVRQPWAHAIIHLGKDVENRSWATNHRGILAIHAGRGFDHEAMRDLQLTPADVTSGAFIGAVILEDCVRDHRGSAQPVQLSVLQERASISKWAEPDSWHWILREPQAIDPLPFSGRLGLFDPPFHVVSAITSRHTLKRPAV